MPSTSAYPDDFPSYAVWQAFLKAQQPAAPAPVTPAPASPAPPKTLSGAPAVAQYAITPVARAVAPPVPAAIGGWTLAAREAQVGVIADTMPIWPEPDDALVPQAVRVSANLGINRIGSPVVAPPPPGSPGPPALAVSTTASRGINKNAPVVYYTYKRDVPLTAGQTLAFRTGKGYYASTPPVVSPSTPTVIPGQAQSPLDTDDVLVPPGVRVLRRPGITYITAPAPRKPTLGSEPVAPALPAAGPADPTPGGPGNKVGPPPPPPAKAPVDAQVGWRDADTEQRAKQIFLFFLNKGLSAVAAAAIVGNFLVESDWTLDPTSSLLKTGPYKGIGQWNTNAQKTGRWDQFVEWAGQRNIYALTTQLEWTWHELTEPGYSGVLKDLRAARDYSQVVAATDAFGRLYEGAVTAVVKPGDPGYDPNTYKQDPKGIQRSAWREYEAKFALWALFRGGGR
jgi:hypothetical protein